MTRFILATTYIGSIILGQTDTGTFPISILTQLGIAGIFFWVWQRADSERKEAQKRERETLVSSTERLYAGLEVLKDAVDRLVVK